MDRIRGDADAGADGDALFTDGDAGGQVRVHRLCLRNRFVSVGVAKQGGEFVTGYPAQRAARLEEAAELRRDRLEHRVAGLLTVVVVDVLELVEVDEQDRQRRTGCTGAFDFVLDAVAEQGPVRQAGQRVEQRHLLELAVGGVEALVQAVQFELVALCIASCLLDFFHCHGVFDGDGRLGREELQQIEVALREIAAALLVDAREATKEAVATDQRHEQDGACLMFPEVAFLGVEFVERPQPPGALVAQHPAAQAEFDGQRLADDFVGIAARAGTVGIGAAVCRQQRHQHRFGLDEQARMLRDGLEYPIEIEFAANQACRIQQQGDLAFAFADLLPQVIQLLLRFGLSGHALVVSVWVGRPCLLAARTHILCYY